MSKFEKLARALETLSLPQKKLLNKVAEVTTGKGGGQDSERSSQMIVEKAAEKLRIPESSSLGNAAKAMGVAVLETFADPLGPLGKVGKVAKVAGKTKTLTNYEKLSRIRDAVVGKKIDLSPKTMKRLETSLEAAKPKTLDQVMPEKFKRMGYGVVSKVDEPQRIGTTQIKIKEQDPGMVKISETSKTPAKTIVIDDKTKVLEGTGSVPTDSEQYFKRLIGGKK